MVFSRAVRLIIGLIKRWFMATIRQTTPTIGFSGGINKSYPTLIDDKQCQNGQNIVSGVDGVSNKRLGTTQFNTQMLSYVPNTGVRGLYRGYGPWGLKATLALSWTPYINMYNGYGVLTKISDTGETTRLYTGIQSATAAYGYAHFETFADQVIFTIDFGINTVMGPWTYDFNTGIVTYLIGAPPAKYVRAHKDYLFMFNAMDSSRLYISAFQNPASWQGYEEVGFNDGDTGTGIESLFGNLYAFKQRKIYIITGSIFDLTTGGDMAIQPFSTKIGCIAPNTLVNTGSSLVFLSSEGITLFNGSSLNVISKDVESIVNGIPEEYLFDCVGAYLPKEKWYIFSYRDGSITPNCNNSCLVYDFNINQWYPPFKGINASSFCVWDGAGDRNEVFYGCSDIALTNKLNVTSTYSDAPRQRVILSCQFSGWTAVNCTITQDMTIYKKSLYSTKIVMSGVTPGSGIHFTEQSSEQSLAVFSDGAVSPISDIIHWWIYFPDKTQIDSMRLLFSDTSGFTNCFSYPIPMASMSNGWNEFNIPKSDFGTLGTPNWASIVLVKVYVEQNTNGATLWLDDIRLISATNTAIEAYRDTKTFDLQRPEVVKHLIKLYPEMDKSINYNLKIEGHYDNNTSNSTLFDASTSTLDSQNVSINIGIRAKNVFFRFYNNTINEPMKLIKMAFSYIAQVMR